jgi:hypothetical protein
MATIKYWNGTAWIATSIGAEVYSQPSAPATTTVGALWIDTDETPPVWSTYFVNQIYAMTSGYTADRALNPQATSINEVAAVLATLIDDLRAAGIIRTS